MGERRSDLLTRLRERYPAGSPVEEVEAFLAAEGYDRRQIGEILALLGPEFTGGSGPARHRIRTPMTFRVLGPHERGRFAPEAWGHLLSLSSAGLLNAAELEHVIDRALTHIDGRIALDDLRSLMEGVGLDDTGPAQEQVRVH